MGKRNAREIQFDVIGELHVLYYHRERGLLNMYRHVTNHHFTNWEGVLQRSHDQPELARDVGKLQSFLGLYW